MSRWCLKWDGSQVATYRSDEEARRSAEYVTKRYGRPMVHYACDRCGYWHLGLLENHTPSIECHWCTDSKGKLKRAYETREGAERRAEIIGEETGYKLYVYECPYGCGWHLTKQLQ